MARGQPEIPTKRDLLGIIQQFRPDQRQENSEFSDIKCLDIFNMASDFFGGSRKKDTYWSDRVRAVSIMISKESLEKQAACCEAQVSLQAILV